MEVVLEDGWFLTCPLLDVSILLASNSLKKLGYSYFIGAVTGLCGVISSKKVLENKPKGLKVAKEDQRSIGLMVNGLDDR